jgi:His-Xaa-Ser system protein HxsD
MPKPIPGITISGSTIEIRIDPKIYPLEAILTATYYFIDDFYIFLDQKGSSGKIIVNMMAKKTTPKSRLAKFSGEFYNDLLAETLRLEINERNIKFREDILEQAIASALTPSQPQVESGAAASEQDARIAELIELDEELKKIIEKTKSVSYIEDPLGIGIPVTDDETSAKTTKRPTKKKN